MANAELYKYLKEIAEVLMSVQFTHRMDLCPLANALAINHRT